jgi:hypothetical protein
LISIDLRGSRTKVDGEMIHALGRITTLRLLRLDKSLRTKLSDETKKVIERELRNYTIAWL